ncbi:hypothetical protein E2320_000953 [Naja naja]|nr:hypothetical protein E2320_000953 [Naja naja]
MEAHGHICTPEPFLRQNARMPIKKDGGGWRPGSDMGRILPQAGVGFAGPSLKGGSSSGGAMPGWGILNTALASNHLKASVSPGSGVCVCGLKVADLRKHRGSCPWAGSSLLDKTLDRLKKRGSTSNAEAAPDRGRMAKTHKKVLKRDFRKRLPSPFGNPWQFHGGMVLTAKDRSCEWPEPLTCLGVRVKAFRRASPWPLPAPGLLPGQLCLLPLSCLALHLVHSCLTKLFCTFIPSMFCVKKMWNLPIFVVGRKVFNGDVGRNDAKRSHNAFIHSWHAMQLFHGLDPALKRCEEISLCWQKESDDGKEKRVLKSCRRYLMLGLAGLVHVASRGAHVAHENEVEKAKLKLNVFCCCTNKNSSMCTSGGKSIFRKLELFPRGTHQI